jgi:thiol-disulfide isomerase/thioredoxin
MNNKIITFFCLIFLMGCQNNDIEVLNGPDTSFGKLQGKWIVVNYWADWCAPCIKEIPELVEFAEENKDILVYAFNFDELDSDDLAPIAKKFKVDIPSLISHPREIWGIQTPPAVPATFFINPEGVLVKSFFRPQTKDSLNEILDGLQKSV